MNNFAKKLIILILILAPLVSLALGALAWLRYGIDMPWFDDWRGYVDGNIHSLNPDYLFRAVNDTLAPVGFALDALAQRYLGGNSIAYQLISMIAVLGGLMWLQWKLLIESLGDKLQASVCFLLVIFMLQPDSYWGWENLAYHQALPLVFIMAAIFLVVFSKKSIKLISPLIFIIGILAGFTYISGAIGVFVCGATLFILSFYFCFDEGKRDFRIKSLWLLIAGLVATVPQIYFAILKTKGTHAGIPLALPSELDFWFFYLGKIGRSLLLSQEWPMLSFVFTVVVVLIALMVGWGLFMKERRNQSDTLRERNLVIVYFSLGAVIFVYLGMVSAGRANFRPEDVNGFLDVYCYGFYRFHYFWMTLFWPWLVAGIIVLAKERKTFLNNKVRCFVVGVGVLFFLASVRGGVFSHFEFQENVANTREVTAKCLLDSVQRGSGIHCPGLVPPRGGENIPDSFPGYLYAYKTNASFVRGFPILFANISSIDEDVFFDEKKVNYNILLVGLKYLSPGRYFSQNFDPQLKFSASFEKLINKCIIFDIIVDMSIEKNARAQIFYDVPGEEGFSENKSKALIVNAVDDKSLHSLVFRLESSNGFSGKFRFDPVDSMQEIHLSKIRGRCRMMNN